MTFASPKGQGATEYLVLLAVVLIVAMVAIALLGFFPGLSYDAKKSESDSYWRSASRHSGKMARCSRRRFCSSSLSWPEVETAQSSRNSSWGPLGDNAPAPAMARTFYHTASLPGNLPAEICLRNFSSPR